MEQFDPRAHPTFFEVVTVLALRYFAEQRCQLVIWETGLGGRLDATNMVTPMASVITGIDFDHQQWLGSTLEEIAAEKAGIIKPGIPVITGALAGRGLEVIAAAAREQEAPLTHVTMEPAAFAPLDSLALSLPGEHQKFNAALALATVRVLQPQLPVSAGVLGRALESVSWPGRMQMVRRGERTLVLDGAHNIGSAQALREAFRRQFTKEKPLLILGVLADKDWPAIADALASLAARIILVPVQSARTLAPELLAEACRKANPEACIEVSSSLAHALERAESHPLCLITGSLYLVGEALERLGLSPAPPTAERALNEWGPSQPEISAAISR